LFGNVLYSVCETFDWFWSGKIEELNLTITELRSASEVAGQDLMQLSTTVEKKV